jgi:hypothetical protein
MSRSESPLAGRMVFVVGSRRSGTNLVQRVLASHPQVAAVPSETFIFHHAIARLFELVQHSAVGSARTGRIYVHRDEFLDAVRDLCDGIFAGVVRDDATRVLERTPHHAHVLDVITAVYPDARILHIIRDGRDVARSLLAQDWGPTSLAEAAEEWRSAVAAARREGAAFPGYREVRYERLFGEPDETVAELFTWLGVEAGSSHVEAAVAELGVRYNVNPGDAIALAKWRSEWGEHELAAFEEVGGDLLAELGYQPAPVVPSTARRSRPPRWSMLRRPALRRPAFRSSLDRLADARAERRAVQRLDRSQVLVDQLFELIAADRLEALEALLAANVRVAFAGPEGSWEGRGGVAVERLRRLLADDEAMRRGRQVRGEILPAIPTTTVIATYSLDGRAHDRVVAVTVQGERISELKLYRPAEQPN